MTDPVNESIDNGRRRILIAGALLGAGALLTRLTSCVKGAEAVADEATAVHEGPIPPPGARSTVDFLRRCTVCGLCVEACPTGVLRASTDEYGAVHAMKPTLIFDDSYCRVVCNRCTQVCPTGALRPLTHEEKRQSPIGRAEIATGRCISVANGVSCGVCSRRCPTGAIVMQEDGDDERPVLNAALCIGCGACEYICPADAIVVNPINK